MKKISILFIIFAALFSWSNAFATDFYLSTEKSFMQDEDARIKIESREIGSVSVRLYQIQDPAAFIKARKNISRIYIESEYIKRNPTELIFQFVNLTKNAFRSYAKKFVLNKDTKKVSKLNLAGLIYPQRVKSSVIVGKIKDYTFVKEFTKELDASSGNWVYSYLELGKLPAGLYLAEVYSGSSIAYTVVHVSKTALVIKKAEEKLSVRVVDKKTGVGQDAEIEIYDFSTGQKVNSGRASASGIYEFGFAKNDYSELVVVSKSAGDFTFYKVSFYPVPEVERVVYIYADSPLYKPGLVVDIKGIIRDYKNSIYTLPATQKVTVSILDPRGNNKQLGDVKVSEFGTFTTNMKLDEKAATGIYKIIAVADSKSYVGEFRVEQYIAPKFKVKVVTERPVLVGNETLKFKVSAQYFTGNKVSMGELKYSIYKVPLREDILESDKDIFEDPSYAAKIEFVNSASAKLNDKGEYEGSFSPASYGTDRDYVFIVKAEVADSSYARASGSLSVKVVQAEFMMQSKVGKSVYVEGEEVRIVGRVLDAYGKPVKDLTVAYKAVLEEGSVSISGGTVKSDTDGNIVIAFPAKGKGFLKITVTAFDKYNNKVEDNIYTWIGQDGATFVYSSGDITVVMDKDEYAVGDKARIFVISPVGFAESWITTERERIFTSQLKKLNGNTMMMEVPITEQLSPNFFFSIVFVYNNQIYENSVKIKAPPADKVLNVSIVSVKDTYAPKEQAKFMLKVTDNKGNPVQAELSFAVINEALYQLAPEIAPDARLFFYSYRWNSVSTMNSIGLRFYGYSKMMKEKVAMNYYKKKVWDFEDFLHTGNRFAVMKDTPSMMAVESMDNEEAGEDASDGDIDDSTKELKKSKGGKGDSDAGPSETGIERKIFKDKVLFNGQVKTDGNGMCEVPVTFPDNLTEWRIVALAVSKDTKVGKSFINVKTSKEFFVRVNMPERLSYKDSAKGFVTVVNSSGKAQTVKLSIKPENISIDSTNFTLTVQSNTERIVPITISPYKVAKSKVRFEAAGEFSKDVMIEKIDVLPVSLKMIDAQTKLVETEGDMFKISIPSGAIPETISFDVGLAEMDNPFGVVAMALPFLKMYPYGCVEQTTSSFLPNLVAFQAAKKLKIELPVNFKDKDDILKKGLQKLYGFQNADGGWGWWGEGQSDPFMTSYVMYAMQFVKKNFPSKIDQTIYKKGVQALKKQMENYTGQEDGQIYGYYVLALCGEKYKDYIKEFAKRDIKDPYILSLLTLTAQKSGLISVAKDTAQKLDKLAVEAGAGVYWGQIETGCCDWYDNSVITTSYAVRALMASGVKTKNIDKGIIYIMMQRQGDRWISTYDTSEAVYAISEYALKVKNTLKHTPVDVYLDQEKLGTMTFEDNNYKNSIKVASSKIKPGKKYNVQFKVKEGKYIGNFRLEYNTSDTTIAAADKGIAVKRKYYKVVNTTKIEALPANATVKPGEVVLVEMETTPTASGLEYVILEDGIPAGFLPVFDVNAYKIPGVKFFDMTHHEFGKNTASFFFKSFIGGKVFYLIQATYPGVYYSLPALAYGMYETEKRGNSESALIQVEMQ